MGPTNEARLGLLDSVIVLLLACMVVLLLLWISAQIHGVVLFEKLPDWLTKAASSIWTYLTGGASSGLLALLRSRSREPKPNYLLWTFCTAMAMLLLVFAVGFIFPAPLHDALLKFSLKSDVGGHPNVSFTQRLPSYRQSKTIGAELDGRYQEYVEFPGQRARFYARMVRAVTDSQEASNPLNPVTEFCFLRSPKPPTNNPPMEVQMDCLEGKRCSVGKDDPGWAEICPAEIDWRAQIRIARVVYAGAPEVQLGWKVPSLETLRKMTDQKRVGYAEFTIKSTQLSALKQAETFQYSIKVNGSPVYVDGWAPEDMLKPLDVANGFTFSFGLENLNFSGADNGCENIEVGLQFRQKERVIRQAVISRKYAALRDADSDAVTAQDGTIFTWGGKYVKAPNEDRVELFILSTPDLSEAKSVKTRVDAARLSYDGMDVVAVLRPPLDKPQYGIVIGLRQSTGQIRFTYDRAFAEKLNEWTLRQQTQNRNLLGRNTNLYETKEGDAGTGRFRSCNAAGR